MTPHKLTDIRTNITANYLEYREFKWFTVPMELIGTQLVKEYFEPNRKYMDNLKDDMAARGQLEPIMVKNEGDHYWLLDGAHRFFAARELGWDEINVFIVRRGKKGFIEVSRPVKIKKSIYPDWEQRKDEPWRAVSYD